MNKQALKKRWFIIIFLTILFAMPPLPAAANQATSINYGLNQYGWFVRTQDAYLPDRALTGLGLNEPQDLYIDKDDKLYIADTNNRRVVIYDIGRGIVEFILEYPGFRSPKGVFAAENGDIYIADSAAQAVFRFNRAGELLETFTRPLEPAYGDTAYNPMKIAVDNRGSMYIVSEGVYNGVIQLANNGEFLGYFTMNKTRLTLQQMFQDLIFTRFQRERLAARIPLTFTNVFIDGEGIVYTTTTGMDAQAEGNTIKKHNTAGINMFDWVLPFSHTMVTIWVDNNGIIFAGDINGNIGVYTSEGEFVYLFFANSTDNNDIAGLFQRLSAIAVDSRGYIWGADSDKSFIQSFYPTEYAAHIYEALTLFTKGRYAESRDVWTEILRLNQMSVIAHNGMGKAGMYSHAYDEAMLHFKVAGNRYLYSQAYWEVRNRWMQKNLGPCAGGLLVLLLASRILTGLDKKKRFRRFTRALSEKIRSWRFIYDILYAFRISRRPIDGFYDVKVKKAGSFYGATVLYILFFISFIYYQVGKGFIYQYQSALEIDFFALAAGFFSILFLFIITNYLSSSILDGEGSLTEIYLVPAYSAMPAILAMLSVTLLSHVLTLNETVFLDFILYLGLGWSALNIMLGLTQIHDYLFRETLKSLFISFIFMLVAGFVLTILSVMWGQSYLFITEAAKEVWRNVTGSYR